MARRSVPQNRKLECAKRRMTFVGASWDGRDFLGAQSRKADQHVQTEPPSETSWEIRVPRWEHGSAMSGASICGAK